MSSNRRSFLPVRTGTDRVVPLDRTARWSRPTDRVQQPSHAVIEPGRPLGASARVIRAVCNVLLVLAAVIVAAVLITFLLFTIRLWGWLV